MATNSQIEKKRAKIKGKYLYEKYKYLYHQKPSRYHAAYMELLGINKGQAYTLKHQLKKELGNTYVDPSNVKYAPSVQESMTDVTIKSSSTSDLDELRSIAQDTNELYSVSNNKNITNSWDDCPFEEEHIPSQSLQQTVVPSPSFDISLSGVDSVTIQSFLRLISDRPKSNSKYSLELKLTEH